MIAPVYGASERLEPCTEGFWTQWVLLSGLLAVGLIATAELGNGHPCLGVESAIFGHEVREWVALDTPSLTSLRDGRRIAQAFFLPESAAIDSPTQDAVGLGSKLFW